MSYSIDLSKISLEKYKTILKNQYLLPSREILRNDIDKNLDVFMNAGIHDLKDLLKALSTPTKLSNFSSTYHLSENYLVILRREVKSYEPGVLPLSDFPGISERVIVALEGLNLKSSKHYYEYYLSVEDKSSFVESIDLTEAKALELFCLCDLVRINGVGAIAAKSFFDAGYRSVIDVANTDALTMLEKVSFVNDISHYYKSKLGVKDMQFCIDYAKLIIMLEN